MFELFQSLARYNKNVNSVIADLISRMNVEGVSKEFDTYHKSVHGIMSHVLKADSRWLVRFHAISDEERNKLEASIVDTKSLLDVRKEIDERIVTLIDSWKSKDFNEIFEVEFGRNKIRKETWKMLLQWFNHQVHHRGQLSVLLDMEHIENDYSGVLDKI